MNKIYQISINAVENNEEINKEMEKSCKEVENLANTQSW